MNGHATLDSLLPADMAKKAERVGVQKAEMDAARLLVLAVLAGAFIALGANFATVIATETSTQWPYGVSRLLVGLVFSVGLILVIVGGAELFTGNNLIVMAWAGGKVSTKSLLRNWVLVYVGNFVGALGTACLVALTRQHAFHSGAVGDTALSIAAAKIEIEFLPAVALGILCNALVCLAVWLTFSARTTSDRILAIVAPIAAFVSCGFEHCVANMYFVPLGIMIQESSLAAGVQLTWGDFLLRNLLPVTIGNVLGGAVLVGVVYWFVYLRTKDQLVVE